MVPFYKLFDALFTEPGSRHILPEDGYGLVVAFSAAKCDEASKGI
jgi:hypothetical protein